MDRSRLWVGLAILLLLAGCLQIPTDHQTYGAVAAPHTMNSPAVRCTPELLASHENRLLSPPEVLDANGFTIVNWNLLKGSRPHWGADLANLLADADILLLQEARLSAKLAHLMADRGADWDLAPAFFFRRDPVGVLTAAQITPVMRCMARTPEPLLRVPKSMLITRYPLAGGGAPLAVVNLHSVNFAWGTASYQKLWQEVARILAPHTGPLIVAGDFNTWSAARMAVVADTMARLNLRAVTFRNDTRSTFWGRIVDHIYYRGLTQMESAVGNVTTSDHHPLVVKFKVLHSS